MCRFLRQFLASHYYYPILSYTFGGASVSKIFLENNLQNQKTMYTLTLQFHWIHLFAPLLLGLVKITSMSYQDYYGSLLSGPPASTSVPPQDLLSTAMGEIILKGKSDGSTSLLKNLLMIYYNTWKKIQISPLTDKAPEVFVSHLNHSTVFHTPHIDYPGLLSVSTFELCTSCPICLKYSSVLIHSNFNLNVTSSNRLYLTTQSKCDHLTSLQHITVVLILCTALSMMWYFPYLFIQLIFHTSIFEYTYACSYIFSIYLFIFSSLYALQRI